MKDRVLRDFTPDDIRKIADTFHAWQQGEGYEDMPGFCKSASLEEVRTHEHVLTPGRYVGTAEQKDLDDGGGHRNEQTKIEGKLLHGIRHRFPSDDRDRRARTDDGPHLRSGPA